MDDARPNTNTWIGKLFLQDDTCIDYRDYNPKVDVESSSHFFWRRKFQKREQQQLYVGANYF